MEGAARQGLMLRRFWGGGRYLMAPLKPDLFSAASRSALLKLPSTLNEDSPLAADDFVTPAAVMAALLAESTHLPQQRCTPGC